MNKVIALECWLDSSLAPKNKQKRLKLTPSFPKSTKLQKSNRKRKPIFSTIIGKGLPPLKMNECPPKKVYFNRKYIFQPLTFRDKLLGFPMFSRGKKPGRFSDFRSAPCRKSYAVASARPAKVGFKRGRVRPEDLGKPWGGPKIGLNTPNMDGENHGNFPLSK